MPNRKEYMQEYNKNYRKKHRSRLIEHSKEYYKNHKSESIQRSSIYRKNRWNKKPWTRHLCNAQSRCNSSTHHYFKKGIKCLLTVGEIKWLWDRDRAWLLKRPSLDRIESDGYYTIGNCRFIELKDNKPPKKLFWGRNCKTRENYNKCIKCKTTISPHHAHGLCNKCYNENYCLNKHCRRKNLPEVKK